MIIKVLQFYHLVVIKRQVFKFIYLHSEVMSFCMLCFVHVKLSSSRLFPTPDQVTNVQVYHNVLPLSGPPVPFHIPG